MSDLLQSARLFEVSTKLQSTSSWLNKLAGGETLSGKGSESFKWAGNFLTQVDWNSDISAQSGAGGGLTVSATSTRPKFYESLLNIMPKLNGAGIKSESDIKNFLGGIYKLLNSGGTDLSDFPLDHIKVAGEFLHVLSQSIIIELNNNGLPKQPTYLSVGD